MKHSGIQMCKSQSRQQLWGPKLCPGAAVGCVIHSPGHSCSLASAALIWLCGPRGLRAAGGQGHKTVVVLFPQLCPFLGQLVLPVHSSGF